MSEIRFSCTGCGKCCNTPPMMTIGEMLRLYDQFPFRLAILGSGDNFDGFGNSLARRQMAHMGELGALKLDLSNGMSLTMRLVPMPVGTPSSRRCEKLSEDGKCTIYETRPLVCRTVPFDYMMPAADQDFVFTKTLKAIEAGKFECDVGPEATVVWRDGQFVSGTEVEKGYSAGIKAASGEHGANLLLKMIMEGTFGFDPEAIIDTVLSGNRFTFPAALIVPMVIESPAMFGVESDHLPTLENFLVAQKTICNRMIDANLQRKDSRDKGATLQLREMLRLMDSMKEFA